MAHSQVFDTVFVTSAGVIGGVAKGISNAGLANVSVVDIFVYTVISAVTGFLVKVVFDFLKRKITGK